MHRAYSSQDVFLDLPCLGKLRNYWENFPQEQTLSVFYTRRPIFTPRDVFYAVRLQEN